MNFSFDKADIQESNIEDSNKPRVMKPGIYEVVTSELKSGVIDNEKQTPYIDWTVVNKANEILTHRFYTSTTLKEGSTVTAWDITSSSLLQLVAAACSLDKDTSKDKLTSLGASSTTSEQFTTKLSSLVIGKPFRLKVNGEEVVSTNSSTGKFTKSKFGNYKFAVSIKEGPGESGNYTMGKVYIKALPSSNVVTKTASTSDLPF